MERIQVMADPAGFDAGVYPRDWLLNLAEQLAAGRPQVLVTVLDTRGSTPREPGARMWVGPDFTVDTIGGGHLEWKAIAAARALLAGGRRCLQVERYPLGPALGQCCGGVVWLVFEYLDRDDSDWCARLAGMLAGGGSVGRKVRTSGSGDLRDVALLRIEPGTAAFPHMEKDVFHDVWKASGVQVVVCGAGHIGNAIVRILAGLPVRVTWLDPREDCWPRDLPANVQTVQGDADDVPDMPDNAYWLVLTHNHALDLAIIDAVFSQKPFAFLGLIGSKSKRARFVSRLARKHSPDLIERMCCPVGTVQTSSKLPAVIAVSVAAQLVDVFSRNGDI